MGRYESDVVQVSEELNVALRRLSEAECRSVHRMIRDAYARPRSPQDWGWQEIWNWVRPEGSDTSVVLNDPVVCVSEVASKGAVLLVFEPAVERAIFGFDSALDAARVADECCSSEYGFTDAECSYLLWYNHHEYLIAFGSAISGLRAYAAAHGLAAR